MLIIGELCMSYYYRRKYKFSHHGLLRIKSRLNLKQETDIDVIDYCIQLIESSNEIYETKDFNYFKVNRTNLYFIIKSKDNLVVTLTPIKPEKLLRILDND